MCAGPAAIDERHPDRCDTSYVRTLQIYDNTMKVAAQRNDQWALEVLGRLQACHDLVAEEAVYHRNCLRLFCSYRLPKLEVTAQQSERRSVVWQDENKLQAFNKLCDWLEVAEDKLHTITDLRAIMQEMAGKDAEVYSEKHLKDVRHSAMVGH